MSTAKHTPGPWQVDHDDRPGMEWNRHINSGPAMTVCFMAHSDGADPERDRANAYLIAAAPELLEVARLAAGINPFGSVHNAMVRDAAIKVLAKATGQYNAARIAWELERTAMGDAFYGNALRVAKDIPGLTDDDRALLDRYATGLQRGTDHVKLCDLALRIDAIAKAAGEAQ